MQESYQDGINQQDLYMKLINTFLWGNVAAFDIINLSQNEGKDEKFTQPSYDILFAASGDIRMLLESTKSIEDLINKGINVNLYLNDMSDMVAFRNLIILWILSTKYEEGIDLAIQIWYSSAMTSQQILFLKTTIIDPTEILNVPQDKTLSYIKK